MNGGVVSVLEVNRVDPSGLKVVYSLPIMAANALENEK